MEEKLGERDKKKSQFGSREGHVTITRNMTKTGQSVRLLILFIYSFSKKEKEKNRLENKL